MSSEVNKLKNIKIYVMSENDPRAFAEYTTHATSWQLRIPVQIVAHELFKWIVEESNDGKNLIDIKEYARLTLIFARKNPEFFEGSMAQKMLEELTILSPEIQNQVVKVDNYVKPSALSMANTKLSNYLFDKDKDLTELTALIVSGNQEEEVTVKTQVFLSLEGNLGVEISPNITAYDRAVHDGVCSVITNNSKMSATNRQIYEAMTGKSTTSPQALGHVTRSLNKLNRTKIFIDYTQQAKAKGIECDKMVFKGNLLDFQEVEIVFNKSQSVSGYKFLTTPILYKYALEMGQVITVDSTLLNSPHVANTDESIVLKHYLLRRIEAMKNKNNHVDSNKILFDTMFEYCGVNGNRIELARKREIVFKILQDWKKMKYIKEFTEYRGTKNKVLGVEIILHKPKKEKVDYS